MEHRLIKIIEYYINQVSKNNVKNENYYHHIIDKLTTILIMEGESL